MKNKIKYIICPCGDNYYKDCFTGKKCDDFNECKAYLFYRLDNEKEKEYNLYCESCEYDWWSNNIDEECPICKGIKNEKS